MYLSSGERSRGRNDCDTTASLGKRDQGLRIARLEDDALVYMSDPAGAVEHFTCAESLAQQQDALVPKIGHVDCPTPRQTMPWGHCCKDTNRK